MEEGYIGYSSKTAEQRFKQHTRDSTRKEFSHYPIYRAMAKYGEDLVVETLLEGSSEYCLEVEKKLRPSPKIGWNISIGGSAPSEGVKQSPETIAKRVATTKSRGHVREPMSEETKQKLRESLRGRKHTKEHIEKCTRARIGQKRSEEAKENMRKAQAGKVISEETKAKISKTLTGQILSQETRDKMSKGLKGLKRTPETCKNLSDAKSKWLHPHTDPLLWIAAIEFYKYYLIGEKSMRQLSMETPFSYGAVKTLYKYFKQGWIPSEDSDYCNWKAQKELE